jgi:hypothetical protein
MLLFGKCYHTFDTVQCDHIKRLRRETVCVRIGKTLTSH